MSEVIDNKANRIRVLKEIIKHLHAGNPPEQVRKQMERKPESRNSPTSTTPPRFRITSRT
jgi:hypothetical protein